MRIQRVLVTSLASLCIAFAQAAGSDVGDLRFKGLVSRLEWEQFWHGVTTLKEFYDRGYAWHLFWTRDRHTDIGVCSDLSKRCFYFPSVAWHQFDQREFASPSETWIECARAMVNGGVESSEDGQTRIFPMNALPEALRNRQRRPAGEIEALKRRIGCPNPQSKCSQVLIPFYDELSAWVPVYRQCSADSRPSSCEQIILFISRLEGQWILTATDKATASDEVSRIRERIRRHLMVEVR